MFRPHQLLLLMSLALTSAQIATAQSVVDPLFLEFTASAEHAALDELGQPMVSRYDFLLYTVGSATPPLSISLGKPTPDASGTIRLSLSTILSPPPANGITYEVRVVAVGPTGSASSAPSNSFSFGTVCDYSVSPASRSVGAAAASSTFAVTAPAGCVWTAASNVSWITITGGTSGTGGGTVAFAVATNSSSASRSGTLTIAGRTLNVSQAGVPCTYSVSPASRSVGAAAASSTFAVTAPAGCAWTAANTASWITITGGASGNGDGTVAFTIAANASSVTRTGTLTIAGQTRTVSQAGVPCTYTVSPTSQLVARTGGSVAFAVTSPSGCTWSSSEQSSWISIAAGSNGTGSGTVTLTIAGNTDTQARSAAITVADRIVTILQGSPNPPSAPSGMRIIK